MTEEALGISWMEDQVGYVVAIRRLLERIVDICLKDRVEVRRILPVIVAVPITVEVKVSRKVVGVLRALIDKW